MELATLSFYWSKRHNDKHTVHSNALLKEKGVYAMKRPVYEKSKGSNQKRANLRWRMPLDNTFR